MRSQLKRSDSNKRVAVHKRKAMAHRVKKKSHYDQILYKYQFPDTLSFLLENRRDVYTTLAKLRLLQNQLADNGYADKADSIIPKLRRMMVNWEDAFVIWMKEGAEEKEAYVNGFIEFADKKGMRVTHEEAKNMDQCSRKG